MNNQRVSFILFIGAILLAAGSRFLPHPPNFTPIGAIALFGATFFNKKYLGIILALSAMLVSDLIIGFHSTIIWVYASFVCIALLGMNFEVSKSLRNLGLGAISASIIFFIISNFGVWISGGYYPATFEGLLTCFTMALPFFQNTLAGDLFFTLMIFGGYHLISSQLKVAQVKS